MNIRTTCPYCNAVVALPAVPPGKVPCPRCDQAFAVTQYQAVTDEASAPVAAPQPLLTARRAWVVSLLLSAVAVGAAFFFLRSDPEPPPPPPTRVIGTTPPIALSGLTLLPAKANIVFAMQPGPLTDDDLPGLGLPAPVLNGLREGGITLAQIDHLAGGLTLASDSLIPGLAVVLKLRAPLADEEPLLKALKAEKKAKTGRATYAVTLGLPLTMVKIDDTTYLFGLTDADLVGVPGAVPLKEILAAKLSPSSYAWLATADEAWADKPTVKAAAKSVSAETFAKLKGLRQAVVGLSLEPEPRLRITLAATDAAAATALRDELKARFPAAGPGGSETTVESDVPFNLKTMLDARRLGGGP